MSEAIRVRRKRRRRGRSIWGEPGGTPPPRDRNYLRSRRRLAWAMAFAFGLAALLFACILNPSGVGVGTVRPLFSRSQGELVVANGDDYAWDAVSIRPNFLWNGDVEGVPHLARGGAHRVSLGSGGILGFDLPLLVLVTCDKPGGGRSGFWIGLAG